MNPPSHSHKRKCLLVFRCFVAAKMELWRLLVLASLGACVLAVGLLLMLRQGKVEEVVAFFHPFTNDGGGGERVLWCAVRAVQEMVGNALPVVIYTGDEITPEALAARAFTRFGVKLVEIPVVRCSSFVVPLWIVCIPCSNSSNEYLCGEYGIAPKCVFEKNNLWLLPPPVILFRRRFSSRVW